jgi:ectoine hydroxylase-related dioxygenase (phytanoyl-CoA dioxygenase family)
VVVTEVEAPAQRARELTDAEVEAFRSQGWVHLERLVEPTFAAELLAAAKDVMGERPGADGELPTGDTSRAARGGKVLDAGFFQDYHFIARDDRREPFRSFVFSPENGRAAQRLMARKVPVRYHSDLIACKMPAGGAGGKPTAWHQDFPALPFDRYGTLTIWLALDEIPPERGAMRFLTGSHRQGPLGRVVAVKEDLFETYPDLLDRYEMSEPLHLRPGDATVHDGLCVHGAPTNETDEPRWALIAAYFPGDTLYTGASNHNFNGLGLEVNEPLEHPRFPVVCR